LIVKFRTLEGPPPGDGVDTLTETEPAEAISGAEICAWSWVLEVTVVVRGLPYQTTAEDETKFVPVTEREKAALPAVAEEGLSEVIVGAGLLTVKVEGFDVPPPGAGLETVTGTGAPEAMSAAVI
jgi:hypothetical protein